MPPNDADDFQETERSINRILHSDLSAADLVPAERIEEFTPRGLLNLPNVEVTLSGTYDAAVRTDPPPVSEIRGRARGQVSALVSDDQAHLRPVPERRMRMRLADQGPRSDRHHRRRVG